MSQRIAGHPAPIAMSRVALLCPLAVRAINSFAMENRPLIDSPGEASDHRESRHF